MKGDLTSKEALLIEGTYSGTINAASETVLVRRTAQLSGELAAAQLHLQAGTKVKDAALSGNIKLTD